MIINEEYEPEERALIRLMEAIEREEELAYSLLDLCREHFESYAGEPLTALETKIYNIITEEEE